MQPETHPSEAAVPAPEDLLPPSGRKGLPRVTVILGVGLLAAATFLAGIEAQRQWGGNSSSPSRFGGPAGLGGGLGGGTGTGPTGAGGVQGGGGFAGRGGGFTSGTVKLVQGTTVYITTSDGNTVKVSVPSTATITKTATAKLSGVKVGDTVTAIGTASSNGVIKAVSLRLGNQGLGGGFGGFGPPSGNGGGNGTAPGTNGG